MPDRHITIPSILSNENRSLNTAIPTITEKIGLEAISIELIVGDSVSLIP